jgi:hypothetical protein
MTGIPSFSVAEVELLVASVRKTLEHLREANERLGGGDAQMIETGQRYSVLLEKLQTVSDRSAPTQS